jgi:predicted membrane protein
VKGEHYLISISAPDDPIYIGNLTSYTYTVQEAIAPIPSVAGIPLIYYIVGAVAVVVAIGIIIFGYKAMKHTIEDETERRRKFVRRKSVHAIEEESERKFIKKKQRGEDENE